MERLGRLLLVVMIALAHGAGFWWLMQTRERAADEEIVAAPEPPPEPPSLPASSHDAGPNTDAAALQQRSAEPTSQASPAQPSHTSTEPLPPVGTPLAQMLPALEARAARGDTAAACRLAVEGERCLRDRDAGAAVEFFERNAAADPALEAGAIGMIAGIEDDAARSVAVCAGVPQGWAEDHAWRHMQAAAPTYPALATRYAVAPPLQWELADVQADAWMRHRAAAPQLLRDAARAGDPHAIFLLQRAYAGQQLPNLGDAFAPDPAQALVYAMVLLRFADAQTAQALQQEIETGHIAFDETTWRALQVQADAITQQHFSEQVAIDFTSNAVATPDPQMCESP